MDNQHCDVLRQIIVTDRCCQGVFSLRNVLEMFTSVPWLHVARLSERVRLEWPWLLPSIRVGYRRQSAVVGGLERSLAPQ